VPRSLVRAFSLSTIVLAGLCLLSTAAGAAEFYVSPGGLGSNTGTASSPWDLATALSQPAAVKPGDTIWLRGGTYRGTFTSRLTGTSSNPIVVRQYPGERATIDGGDSGGNGILVISGAYTWYWGFEVMSSDLNRVSTQISSWPTDIARGEAIQIEQTTGSGVGTKFINLIVHDARQGFSFWKEAVDAEIYGCLIYNNGWIAPDRGHGHGIYTQNDTGTKKITDNIIFNQFGYGIHAYGSSTASLNNFTIQGNASFNNGSLAGQHNPNIFVGGGQPAAGLRVLDNSAYVQPLDATTVRFGSDAANIDAVVSGNQFVGFSSFVHWNSLAVSANTFVGSTTVAELVTSLTLPSSYYSWNNNSYISQELQWQPFNLVTATAQGLFFPEWQAATGADANSLYTRAAPGGTQVIVRPNRYEEGRANIVVYNWDHAASVSVDPGAVLAAGARYEIRSALDFTGDPVTAGTYDGGPILLPMTGQNVAPPVGASAADSPAPEFNAFVLLTVAAKPTDPALPARQRPDLSERTPRRDRARGPGRD
jgi:hypothetical protein